MGKSHMRKKQLHINVKGSGETEHQAVEATFKEMRQQVSKEFDRPIISLQTVDYIVNDLKKTEKSEAFLFVFMKRQRVQYELDVTIVVDIDYVQIEGGKS